MRRSWLSPGLPALAGSEFELRISADGLPSGRIRSSNSRLVKHLSSTCQGLVKHLSRSCPDGALVVRNLFCLQNQSAASVSVRNQDARQLLSRNQNAASVLYKNQDAASVLFNIDMQDPFCLEIKVQVRFD